MEITELPCPHAKSLCALTVQKLGSGTLRREFDISRLGLQMYDLVPEVWIYCHFMFEHYLRSLSDVFLLCRFGCQMPGPDRCLSAAFWSVKKNTTIIAILVMMIIIMMMMMIISITNNDHHHHHHHKRQSITYLE